jgi:hypothetical protein
MARHANGKASNGRDSASLDNDPSACISAASSQDSPILLNKKDEQQ